MKTFNIAGFSDPVMGTLFAAAALMYIVQFFSKLKKPNEDDYSLEDARKTRFYQYHEECTGRSYKYLLGFAVGYALIAGALSVTTDLAFSNDLIGDDNSAEQMAIYFGGYACAFLWIGTHLWNIPEANENKKAVIEYKSNNGYKFFQ